MPQQRQTLLMCAPDYFGVNYVINAWMENQIGKADLALATRQWHGLRDALAAHAAIALVPPRPGLPDMVFTANAGLVLGKQVIVSRFHATERQAEEAYFRAWFAENGFEILDWPHDISFEGAGDALFDRGQNVIWCGYGFRSDTRAAAEIEKRFGWRGVTLKLVDPRFYHIDTCLCPLQGGWLLYYPAAFDAESQKKILSLVPAEKLIAVSEQDAAAFCCNAVEVNGHIFMNNAGAELQQKLRHIGLTPVLTPLSEFMKAGGAAKCLILSLAES